MKSVEEFLASLGLNTKYLEQYGVRGMRWGVRKKSGGTSAGPVPVRVRTQPGKRVKATGGQNRPPSDDAKRAAALKQKARASTIDSLSNSELTDLIRRMNLEQSYAKLNPPKQGPIKRFLKPILTREVDSLINQGKPGPGLSLLSSNVDIKKRK